MSSAMILAGMVGGVAGAYGAVALTVAHLFTRARRQQPQLPEGILAERVTFAARGERLELAAWYRRATDARGAVILVHGRHSCRGDELRGSSFDLVARLVSRGLSVVMLDLRGHGESEGRRLTFGRRERHDVLGAVDFLLARGYEAGRIGVLGASMGAVSAIGAAAEEHAIGALVSDSAFADFGQLMREQFTRLTRLPRIFLGGAMVAARAFTGESLLRHSVTRNMERLRGRAVMVIHAAHDRMIGVSHAHALAGAAGTSAWVTPARAHVGSFMAAREEYAHRVVEFFCDHLGRGQLTLSGRWRRSA